MIFLIILLSAIATAAAAAPSGQPETNMPTSPNSSHASPVASQGGVPTTLPAAPPVGRANNVMQVGSPCHGLEGEWNCMATAFQRCASGQWSAVLGTACGTVCGPEGLTRDFQPAFASWFPPAGDAMQTVLCTEAPAATGGPADAPGMRTSGAPAASRSTIWAVVLGLTGTALLCLVV